MGGCAAEYGLDRVVEAAEEFRSAGRLMEPVEAGGCVHSGHRTRASGDASRARPCVRGSRRTRRPRRIRAQGASGRAAGAVRRTARVFRPSSQCRPARTDLLLVSRVSDRFTTAPIQGSGDIRTPGPSSRMRVRAGAGNRIGWSCSSPARFAHACPAITPWSGSTMCSTVPGCPATADPASAVCLGSSHFQLVSPFALALPSPDPLLQLTRYRPIKPPRDVRFDPLRAGLRGTAHPASMR